jgi:glycosyltransferase involved in cell wall biosynthesis
MKPIHPAPRPPVSAVMITYNESVNLRRTLARLNWCNEIIVVDSYSTDGTERIARDMQCKFIQRSFTSYGEQKSFAISQCKNEWVLCLDADEYLTSELVEEILQELEQPENIQAFAFRSNLVFRNQPFRFGKESKRLVVKLFKRNTCRMSNDRVHEKIMVKGRIKNLENRLLHYSYRDINQYFTKFDRYTEWGAEKYLHQGKRKSKSVILLSIPYYFLRYYLLDGNFLNGMNGFYWSALMAFYHFVKYIKLEDMVQADHSFTYAPVKPLIIQLPLNKSHLLVSENGNLIRQKKNGRI